EDTTRFVVYENGLFKSLSKGSVPETLEMTEFWKLTNEMVRQNGGVEYVFENGTVVARPNSARKIPRLFFDENRAVWVDAGDHYITGREGNLAKVSKETKLPEKLVAG